MSKIIDKIIENAKKINKTIVLAEGEEPRTVRAAEMIEQNKIANVILLGDETKLKEMYPQVCFDGIKIVNPMTANVDKYAQELYDL
ncbi:MAG: phosphate acyltransferase, partial [Clostridia bacterium]